MTHTCFPVLRYGALVKPKDQSWVRPIIAMCRPQDSLSASPLLDSCSNSIGGKTRCQLWIGPHLSNATAGRHPSSADPPLCGRGASEAAITPAQNPKTPSVGHMEASTCVAAGAAGRSVSSRGSPETATAADSPGRSGPRHDSRRAPAAADRCQQVKAFLEQPSSAAAAANPQDSTPDGDAATDDAAAAYMLPEEVIRKWGNVLDIVTPESQATNCFTKTYSQYAKVSGKVSAVWHAPVEISMVVLAYRQDTVSYLGGIGVYCILSQSMTCSVYTL